MSSSYKQTIEELKKIKKAQGGNLQNHQKPTFDPFDPFDGSSPGSAEKKNGAQGEHTWRDFYPDLAPADFEIIETTGGIGGQKIRGTMVGTVGFFIPWGKLEQGPPPPTNRESPTRAEWDFSRLHIPSQTHPGKVDVGLCGERVDPPQLKLWFVKTIDEKVPRTTSTWEERGNETDESNT